MTEPTALSTFVQRLAAWRAVAPDAPALLDTGGTVVTYRALGIRMAEIGAALRAAGVPRTGRVAIAMGAGPALAGALLGVAAVAIACPLDPDAPLDRTHRSLGGLGAAALVVDDIDGPAATAARSLGIAVVDATRVAATASARPDDPAPDDAALILQTSGTTGAPKRVILTHGNLAAGASNVAAAVALVPSDRGVCPMPLFHVHGIVAGLLAPLWSGGSVACLSAADIARVADALCALNATWLTAVPTIHAALVGHLADRAARPRLRFVRSASSALPRRLAERLAHAFGAPVVEAYGMTEATHQVASQRLGVRDAPRGSVGTPIGVDVCVLGVDGASVAPGTSGEVAVRGPGVAQRFEATDETGTIVRRTRPADEWLRTGDAGTLDADGHLWLHGRLVQFIDRGGEKIAPREVEEALLDHEAVACAAVLAIPHRTLGEDVAAAVVAHAGTTLDAAALRRFLLERLPARKVPKELLVVEALPTGASGKVDRAALARRLDEARSRAFVAPRGEREIAIARFFGELLATPKVAADDRFFALGGDSLSGMQLLARIEERLGAKLDLRALFEHDTPAALAALVATPPAIRESVAAPPPLARRARRPG